MKWEHIPRLGSRLQYARQPNAGANVSAVLTIAPLKAAVAARHGGCERAAVLVEELHVLDRFAVGAVGEDIGDFLVIELDPGLGLADRECWTTGVEAER